MYVLKHKVWIDILIYLVLSVIVMFTPLRVYLLAIITIFFLAFISFSTYSIYFYVIDDEGIKSCERWLLFGAVVRNAVSWKQVSNIKLRYDKGLESIEIEGRAGLSQVCVVPDGFWKRLFHIAPDMQLKALLEQYCNRKLINFHFVDSPSETEIDDFIHSKKNDSLSQSSIILKRSLYQQIVLCIILWLLFCWAFEMDIFGIYSIGWLFFACLIILPFQRSRSIVRVNSVGVSFVGDYKKPVGVYWEDIVSVTYRLVKDSSTDWLIIVTKDGRQQFIELTEWNLQYGLKTAKLNFFKIELNKFCENHNVQFVFEMVKKDFFKS